MRKVTVIFFIAFALFSVCLTADSRAESLVSLSNPTRLMQIDVRDSFNNSVSGGYIFETSVFFRVYSMFASFGVSHWLSPFYSESVSLKAANRFKLPVVISSFLCTGRNIILYFSEFVLSTSARFNLKALIFAFYAAFMVAFFISKGAEPRFRLPVLIE